MASDRDAPDCVVIHQSAVLQPAMSQTDKVRSTIIDAMLDTVGVKYDIAIVRREATPFVEWDENGEMIAGTFPTLFMMGGYMLPHGSFPRDLVHHLMRYYDGRFENDVTFVATLFNQLQRHSAVRKAARAATTHAKTLKNLGELANSTEFKEALVSAKEDPESAAAKRLNAGLLRILSVIGGTIPFSHFERAATRPKLSAMRYRFGLPLFWITVAPPEQDDITLHRIVLLRKHNTWNDETCVYGEENFNWSELPEDIKNSPRLRLSISNRCPALAALAFERKMNLIQEGILCCPASEDTRKCRNYVEREAGAYGKVAAFNGVVEPQIDGRLHLHMTVYGSSFSPEILTRGASCHELRQYIASWMDAVCMNHLYPATRSWINDWKYSNPEIPFPRACEVVLPPISEGLSGFQDAVQRSTAATNIHCHSKTCVKGTRGKTQCRLCHPAGIHEQETTPLVINKVNGTCVGNPISADFETKLDAGYDSQQGELLRPQISGPVVWEQFRPEVDNMYVETNCLLSGLTASHCNSSVMNGEDAGDLVDEYQQNYMTKEGAGLKNAAAVMLTALEDALKYPSIAEDSATPERQAQYLATRTVNAFGGANEWPISLMIYALLGHKSHVSSESFTYVFSHGFINELEKNQDTSSEENAIEEDITCSSTDSDCADDNDVAAFLETESADSTSTISAAIEELANLAHTEDLSVLSRLWAEKHAAGGARAYKVEGKTIFVSQLESYKYRGIHFVDYSPLEFACIVDIVPSQKNIGTKSSRGRKPRHSFKLDPRHPLFHHYEAVIRTKMLTPAFGGSPPVSCSRKAPNSKKMDTMAKYIISVSVPWNALDRPEFDVSATGLSQLCTAWDSSSASFIRRQRYRQVHNFIQKHVRCSDNEKTCLEWRARNATRWKDNPSTGSISKQKTRDSAGDPEANGVLTDGGDDLYWLTRAAALGNPTHRESVRAIQSTFYSLMGVQDESAQTPADVQHAVPVSNLLSNVYQHQHSCDDVLIPPEINLNAVARRIHEMVSSNHASDISKGQTSNTSGPNDPIASSLHESRNEDAATPEQQAIIDWILTNLDKPNPVQTLTLMHGGAGTGKSFVIHKLRDELLKRGLKIVITCPTGAAASHFPGGMTCHAAFKVGRDGDHVSPKKLAELRLLFDNSVGIIVTDEVSMLGSEFTVTVDKRLRMVYNHDLPFGGKSHLWSGDFLQLEALMGTPLCKSMYKLNANAVIIQARDLFRRFRVFTLKSQQRAHNCPVQQRNLDAFRNLPTTYPGSHGETKFQLLSDEVVDAVTHELTRQEVEQDPAWMDESTILVTSNVDKAALTACTARLLALRTNSVVLRWRKPVAGVPQELLELLYNATEYPALFGYFVKGGCAQVLDNGNGNVEWGVANGTMCKLVSLAWNNVRDSEQIMQMLQCARLQNGAVFDLPKAPDFINVQLITQAGGVVPATTWPPENNLATIWKRDTAGRKTEKDSIIIPIGLLVNDKSKYTVTLARTLMPKPIKIKYSQLAVELALVMTVWKAQGATLKRVLLYLEGTPGSPKWLLDHLYVGTSRVRSAHLLRCLPLSPAFQKRVLKQLQPNPDTTKWRMDVGNDGYWHPP